MEVISEPNNSRESFSVRDAYVALEHLLKFKHSIPDFLLACIADLIQEAKLDFTFYLNSGAQYALFSSLNHVIASRDLSNLAVTAVVCHGGKRLSIDNRLERLLLKYIRKESKCVDIVFTSYEVESLEDAITAEYERSREKIEADGSFVKLLKLAFKSESPSDIRGLLTDFAEISPELVIRQVDKVRIILDRHRDCALLARAFESFYQNSSVIMQPTGLRGDELALCLLLRQVAIESRQGEFEIIE